MNAKQLERASYMAAHAILSTNTSAPHLATPGARRSYMVDKIAERIRNIFELHCSALDESAEWSMHIGPGGPSTPSSETAETVSNGGSAGQKMQLAMQKLH